MSVKRRKFVYNRDEEGALRVEKNGLAKSGSMGILFLGLFAGMAGSFTTTDPQSLAAMLLPLAIVFAVSTLIMLVVGTAGAKLLNPSRFRCIAMTLNCYLGFPYNFMLCQEKSAL